MARKSRSIMQPSESARHPDPARPDDPSTASGGKAQSSSGRSSAQMTQSPPPTGSSAFGDPSPGDENPRELPLPAARDDTAALMSQWRKHRRAGRRSSRQQSGHGVMRPQAQQSFGADAFGDPSPGDENPRPIQPRGGQRS